MKLPDDDRDLVQELLSAPGWRVFINRVLARKIEHYSNDVYRHARSGEGTPAAIAVAKRDAVFEFIEAVYDAAEFTMPENIKALKRGD